MNEFFQGLVLGLNFFFGLIRQTPKPRETQDFQRLTIYNTQYPTHIHTTTSPPPPPEHYCFYHHHTHFEKTSSISLSLFRPHQSTTHTSAHNKAVLKLKHAFSLDDVTRFHTQIKRYSHKIQKSLRERERVEIFI